MANVPGPGAVNLIKGRKPKEYVGDDHMTRGGDILAVLQCVHAPEVTLGRDMAARLREVQLEEWYPAGVMFEMLERLDQKLGSFHLKQVGWTIFQKFHAEAARNAFPNAFQLLSAMNAMYNEGNRGTAIGRWRLTAFDPRHAVLDKTTMHHCKMEEGIVEEALRTIGASVSVKQTLCFRQGAELCRYVIEPNERSMQFWGSGEVR